MNIKETTVIEGGVKYTVYTYSNGRKEWWVNGQRHRIDGPAIEGADGSKEWWLNDKLHRTDGPAVELDGGYKEWLLNGTCHRTDGPAIECTNGSKGWFLNGKEYTKPNYYKELFKQDLITEEQCFLELID